MTEVEQLRDDVAFWQDAHARVDAQRVKAEAKARKATEIVRHATLIPTVFHIVGYDGKPYWMCPFGCEVRSQEHGASVEWIHEPDCTITKARAWLASETKGA